MCERLCVVWCGVTIEGGNSAAQALVGAGVLPLLAVATQSAGALTPVVLEQIAVAWAALAGTPLLRFLPVAGWCASISR